MNFSCMIFSSVQSLSHVRLFVNLWTAARQASLSITNSGSWHVHRVSDAIQPSHPLPSPSPPASIFPSIRVFSSESVLHIRQPKYWSFSFGISPSNEYSGLISFRMDWFDLLAVQGTLKSLLQHHSSKASIFWFSFLYSPTLMSIHNYWKKHGFDQMDLCQQSNVSAFKLRLMGKLFYVASKLYFGLLCFLLILLNWQSRTTHININGVDSLNDVQHVRKHSQKPCKSIAESDPSLHL